MNTKKVQRGNKESNEFDTKQSSTQNQPTIVRDGQRKASLVRRQSRLIGQQQDELTQKVMQKYGIERLDFEMINYNFKKHDTHETQKLQFHQLLSILKRYGCILTKRIYQTNIRHPQTNMNVQIIQNIDLQFTIDDGAKKSIFKELEDRGIKQIELDTVYLIVGVLRQKEQKLMEEGEEDNQSEFIDAFVALGGNPDSSGKVMKTVMLKVIKEEFDLTFDMEKIMERIEASSEELDYTTFCMLFDTQDEDRKRRSSRAQSVLSHFSQRSRKSVNSVASVKIRYQDFEKFCQDFSD